MDFSGEVYRRTMLQKLYKTGLSGELPPVVCDIRGVSSANGCSKNEAPSKDFSKKAIYILAKVSYFATLL